MSNQPFVIERTYNAPVERVWKAVTDKDQMRHWYFDIAEFKPEVGFEFRFEGGDEKGTKYLHICQIVEVVPFKKLKHTWTYEGYEDRLTWVTIELFEEGEKTRLKLTHEGLENLPNLPQYAKENFAKGWTHIMGISLPEFVEEETLSKSIDISAPQEIVWDLLVQEENVRKWAGAFMEGTYAESDYKLGSEVLWKAADGSTMVKGAITELDEPRKLKITYYDDPSHSAPTPLGKYYEQYNISRQNGQSVLSIESGPLAKKWTKMHDPMWEKALKLIKQEAEAKK